MFQNMKYETVKAETVSLERDSVTSSLIIN